MKQLLLIGLTLIGLSSLAQHPTCDGSRYINNMFVPDTTLAINYGNATTFGGNNMDLYLDFFQPSGDVAMKRPLIVFAFGGSFIGGARGDMHSLCAYYSAKGYTCASIDYRLYDGPFFPFPDSVDMTDVVIKAVSDMKASIRFFVEDAATSNQYRIDTNLIFVSGISAGSIVASHVGLLQQGDPVEQFVDSIINANGGWTGNSSNNTQYGDDVAGVVNYSGALRSAGYINAGDPPLFSVHDEQDGVVPYGTGSATIANIPIITLQGSFEMDAQAQSEGVTTELITIPNSSGHVSYFDNSTGTDTILQRSIEFLYPIICNGYVGVDALEMDEISVYPNPANGQLQIVLPVDEPMPFRIFDLTGRAIFQGMTDGSRTLVDVTALAKGNYWLEVLSKEGSPMGRTQIIKI